MSKTTRSALFALSLLASGIAAASNIIGRQL